MRVARIEVVFRGFKGLLIGPAQGQDGCLAHCSQLRDNRSFICGGDGVPHDHQIKLSLFTGFNGRGEANRGFYIKSFAGEHQLSGMQ